MRELIPREDRLLLSSHQLSIALHLGTEFLLACQLAATSLQSHVCYFPVTYGGHHLTADILILWFLQCKVLPRVLNVPWALGICVVLGTLWSVVSVFDQMGVSLVVYVCCKNKLLWWGMIALLIYAYEDKHFENSIGKDQQYILKATRP